MEEDYVMIPGSGTKKIIRDVKKEIETAFLDYSMSVIVSRALPDVRDGLKPVHRRILYTMHERGNDPSHAYRKSADTVGAVLGSYHPHGDASVYDAMVRLAQDFSLRYPLVDGQGNFGSVDGDPPAAYRYTEARMSRMAVEMLTDIEKDTIDWDPNFDETKKEPSVLPCRFPNLLVNGSQGIAVGMATNIPPHNLSEVCDALLLLIEKPDVEIEPLVRKVKGPDFPTGGIIIDSFATILANYTQGRGNFRIRAKWEKEDLGQGQYQIVVTEIPYQVVKSKLIERIALLLQEKKIPLLSDVRDESTHDIRIVLEPKSRNVDANLLMEYLFRQTELESRFNMNMNVLDSDNVPRVMSIKEVLQEFLRHRQIVLQRRSNYRLQKINNRLEILSGYLIAYLNLDEIIRIIREEDEPKAVMMKAFSLTDNQAEAILNMKLRSLRKLEETEIKNEFDELSEEKGQLEALLADETLRWQKISEEIKLIREKFGKKTALGRRRTEFAEVAEEIEAAGGEAFAVSTDISKPEDPERLMELVLKKYGKIDILINNAGILETGLKPIDRFLDEDLDRIVETNQKGTMRCMRAAARRMQSGASIVNVASVAGVKGCGGAAYVASKAAVIGVTKHTALRFQQAGIRCNAICPGNIITPMTTGTDPAVLDPDMIGAMAAHSNLKTPSCTAEDVANVILFFASDDSRAITGQVIVTDFGAML